MNYPARFAAMLLIGILPVLVASADVEETETTSGLEALRAVEGMDRPGARGNILGMVGFFGDPDPVQWLILVDQPKPGGGLTEWVVREGKVLTRRKVAKDSGQDMPTIPIVSARIEIDSDRAGQIASEQADEAGVPFEAMHYQLRCRDENREPVWAVHLLGRNQLAVGVQYISAVSGDVLRSVWHAGVNPSDRLSQRSTDEKEPGRSIRMVKPIPRRTEL